MEKIDWKKKYEELKEKSEKDLDNEIAMTRIMANTAQNWSKAFGVLIDTNRINNGDLKDL